MDWRAALRERALADAPLVALLRDYTPTGGTPTKTVFLDDRPQGSPMPALLIVIIDDGRPQHLKGFGLAPGRVQLDSFGSTTKAAWAVIDAAITALVPGGTFFGHKFGRTDVSIGPRSLPERVSSTTVFRVSMDLIFHHAEDEEGS